LLHQNKRKIYCFCVVCNTNTQQSNSKGREWRQTELYIYELTILGGGGLLPAPLAGVLAVQAKICPAVADGLAPLATIWIFGQRPWGTDPRLSDPSPRSPEPLDPIPLVDRDLGMDPSPDPTWINTPSPPRIGADGRCNSRRYQLRMRR
jgi:ribosomal protein L39E